jgi:hypothetical protein
MKRFKLLLIVAALSAASIAQAQTTTSGLSTANGTAGASVDSHDTYNSSGTRYGVATAVGPGLTSSNDTCMGSTSAGVQGMSLGISVGSTWEDKNCRMLKNSRELYNMGYRGAAIKLMCNSDSDTRAALEQTGVDCGESKEAWEKNGEKVAIVQRPPAAPAVAQAPAVITTPQAAAVELHAAQIILADQARKNPQIASK